MYVRLLFIREWTFLTKNGLATFVLATTLFGLTGCAVNDRGDNVSRNNLNANNVNYNNNGLRDIANVSNDNFRVSNRAGKSVEKLQAVELAHVIIRDNDAYVAVKLHNRKNQARMGTTTTRGGSMSTTDLTRSNDISARGAGTGLNGNYPGTTGVTSTDNTDNALKPGTTNIGGTTGVRDTGINGGANFMKASTHLEKDIAHQVRTAEKGVNNVYISYDTDFFNRLTDYTTDTGNGRNRDGLWNDITNTIRRSF
jgi:hypothetical protein